MSSGAELRVVLIGDDPEQQEAFRNDMRRRDDEADLQSRIKEPVAPEQTARPVPVPPVAPPPVQVDPHETPLIQSIDELIAHLDRLIQAEQEGGRRTRRRATDSEPNNQSQPVTNQPEGFWGEFGQRLNQLLDRAGQIYRDTHFGRTIAGQRLLHTGRMVRRAAIGATRAARRSPTLRRLATRLPRMRSARAPAPAVPPSPAPAAAAGAQTTAAAAEAQATTAGAAAGSAATGAQAAEGAAAVATGAGAAIVGPVIAVGIAAAGTALALQQMISAVHRAADSLEDMSPEIATVRAEFEAMHELARLDRAARVGQGVAQLEAARGRIGESMYEVQTKILQLILKFAPLLEGVLDGINAGVRGIDVVIAAFNNLWAKVNDLPIFGGNVNDNQAAQDEMREAFEKFHQALKDVFGNDVPHDMPMDPFLAEVFKMRVGPKNAPAPAAPALGGGPQP